MMAHTHVLQAHSVRLICVPQTKKGSLRMCPFARMVHREDSVGVCQVVCECVSEQLYSHTYNMKLSRHLL